MRKIIIIASIAIVVIIGVILMALYIEPKVAVITYHNVATYEEIKNCESESTWTITVDNFEEQLKYLRDNNYRTITMDEFYQWKQGKTDLPRKSVLITFDDGKLSNYEYAFPLLKEYEMNAIVFIVGSFIENGESKWEGRLTDYMSADLVEKCKEEYPNIEFCSHSYNLHEANSINVKSEAELVQDLDKFESRNINTEYYAYPFGAYNDKMKVALQENNYKLAFRFGPERKDYRKSTRDDLDYEIPRLNFSYNTPMWKFKLRMILPF